MEETTCSACGRQMSLKDLERRTFREVSGELYCPECFLKNGRPKKMRCPDCGKTTTAVLHDGKYTCTHCGREIGGQQEKGVIASAKPSGDREKSDTEPEAPKPAVRHKKKNRTIPILAVALSCFIAVSLVLGALLVRRLSRGVEPAAQPTSTVTSEQPTPKNPLAADEEILRLAEEWQRKHPGDYDGAIELYKHASQKIQDRALSAKAMGIQLHLKGQRDAAAKSDRQVKRELARKLADARKQIQRLSEKLKKATAAVPTPPPLKPQPPTPPPIPAKGVEPKKSNDTARAAYRAAMDKAGALIQDRRYGPAMEAVAAVAAKYRGTQWGAKAETERQRIRGDAYQEYGKLRDRADILAKTGDHDGERELYAKALLFGVPGIDDIVRRKLGAIQQAEETSNRTPAKREPPAIVKKQIDALRNGDDLARSMAARKLGDLGDRAAVPHLITALKDKYWSVRARSAVSLGKLGDRTAVPALVDALADAEKAVVFDAHTALKAISKQSFSHEDKAKWLAWYRTESAKPADPPKQPGREKADSFEATVLARNYGPDTVRFAAPKGVGLAVGVKLGVFRGTDFLCNVVVAQVNEKGEVSGAIQGLKPGAKLGPGDAIVVQLPK